VDEIWKYRVETIGRFLLILAFALLIFALGQYNVFQFEERVREFCGTPINMSISMFGEGFIQKAAMVMPNAAIP